LSSQRYGFAANAAICLLLQAMTVLPARAQVRPVTATDSLRMRVDSLMRQVDSLRAVLARMAPSAAQVAPEQDELAALRAAAAAVAGRDTTRQADTVAQGPFTGRSGNLNQLNPEISVTGDIRASRFTSDDPGDNFEPREFEFSFQSALDPFASTKIFAAIEDGEVDIEEGYAYWSGLPGGVRLDAGKIRQSFGELNRWHLHALPESEYPLVLTTYLGEEGLAGTGISAYRAFAGLGTHEITAQVTRSASDGELFDDGGRLSYLARVLNFWQLSPSTYMQIGASGLAGSNPDENLETRVGGLEFRFTWRPPGRSLYRDWTVRGELLALRKEYDGEGETRLGGYVNTTYMLGRRWIAGLRYDYVEDPLEGGITRQIIPSLSLWQSEWVRLRAQYEWRNVASAASTHRFALQAVWAIGPHKHEIY